MGLKQEDLLKLYSAQVWHAYFLIKVDACSETGSSFSGVDKILVFELGDTCHKWSREGIIVKTVWVNTK